MTALIVALLTQFTSECHMTRTFNLILSIDWGDPPEGGKLVLMPCHGQGNQKFVVTFDNSEQGVHWTHDQMGSPVESPEK